MQQTTEQLIEEALEKIDKKLKVFYKSGSFDVFNLRVAIEKGFRLIASKLGEEHCVYVLTAYDVEKERLGEIIVVDSPAEAQELYKTLTKIYGGINVTLASRIINHVPIVLRKILS